jgi:hypothetical protein
LVKAKCCEPPSVDYVRVRLSEVQRVKETNGSAPVDSSLVNTLKRSIAEKTGRDLTYGD